MTTALIPIADMQTMAEALARSGLFGMKRPEEALALMIVAQAEGRHPGSVAAEYHIIQGRPALKADAMLARFQQAGGKVAWDQYTDACVSAVFTHEAGGSAKIEWTMDRAKKAGLTGKDNWTKYPRQMLRARVISEGVRTVFPAVCVGVYTPEEVQDFAGDSPPRRGPGRPPKQPRDMGPADVVSESENPAPQIDAAARPVATTSTVAPSSAGLDLNAAGDLDDVLPDGHSPELRKILNDLYDAPDGDSLRTVGERAKKLKLEHEKQIARGVYAECLEKFRAAV